jgi:hypothetical protein
MAQPDRLEMSPRKRLALEPLPRTSRLPGPCDASASWVTGWQTRNGRATTAAPVAAAIFAGKATAAGYGQCGAALGAGSHTALPPTSPPGAARTHMRQRIEQDHLVGWGAVAGRCRSVRQERLLRPLAHTDEHSVMAGERLLLALGPPAAPTNPRGSRSGLCSRRCDRHRCPRGGAVERRRLRRAPGRRRCGVARRPPVR